MDMVKLLLLICFLFFLFFASGNAKFKIGGSKSKSKGSSSGSSYPKQQWSNGGSQPSHNYGQPSGGSNYGQPSGGSNYGQPSGGHNYGQPPIIINTNSKSHKSSSGKAAIAGGVVGAAAGAYATHKIHKGLNDGHHHYDNRRPHVVRPRPTKVPPIKIKHIFLATVSRSEWNATRLTELNIRPASSFSKVIVHHTSSADCYNMTDCKVILKAVEQRNMQTKNLDNIGYNFMIGGDGRIYENLAWTMYSKITKSDSIAAVSLNVAFIGDFSIYRPNQKQMDAFDALLKYGDNKDLLKKYRIHGHRDLSCTSCPGDVLYGLIKNMERYEPLLDTADLCGGLQGLSGGNALVRPSYPPAVPPAIPPMLPPSNQPLVQPPYNPAVAPPYPPAAPSPYQPAAPSPYQPAAPSPYQPAAPSPYQPAAPSPYQPAAPSPYQPAAPSPYQPAAPSPYQPAAPSPYQPAVNPSYQPAAPHSFNNADPLAPSVAVAPSHQPANPTHTQNITALLSDKENFDLLFN